ncbi:MAG: hypothetical protein PHW31_01580 [Candidatus Pacebacteria bacterium]|nr:hypothetical protein [Candidatus Paceibacterota bacterium]
MFYARKVHLAHVIAIAIKNMFLATSRTTVQEWRDSYDKNGVFFIYVFQFGISLFSVEIDFKKKGYEVKLNWGPKLGSEFVDIHYLSQLFLKISSKF